MAMSSIKSIVGKAMCCGCGACCKVCPVSAISYFRNVAGYIVPKVSDNCIKCGKCLTVCPSGESERERASTSIDPFVGECINGYIGYASDTDLRKSGQSGGLLTAFLLWLLRNNEIDGAIINTFDANIQRNKAVYVDTEDGVKAGVGSYYAQSTVVDSLLANRGKRIAVVSLGCQSQAIGKLCRLDGNLRNNLILLGLVCGGNYSGDYIDDLVELSKGGRNLGVAKQMRFRCKEGSGWPGDVSVWFDGERVRLPSSERIVRKELYRVPRCNVCFDKMNIYSDVVFGDPWGIKRVDAKEGNTVAITRTLKGERLFAKFIEASEVVVQIMSPAEINKGQKIDEVVRANYIAGSQKVKFEFAKRLMLTSSRDEVVRIRREKLKEAQLARRRRRLWVFIITLLKPLVDTIKRA